MTEVIYQLAYSQIVVGHMGVWRGPFELHALGVIVSEAHGIKLRNLMDGQQRIEIGLPLTISKCVSHLEGVRLERGAHVTFQRGNGGNNLCRNLLAAHFPGLAFTKLAIRTVGYTTGLA